MNKPEKKLVLHRETVRKLSSSELSKIAGGAGSSWQSCVCSISVIEVSDCPLGTSAYTTHAHQTDACIEG